MTTASSKSWRLILDPPAEGAFNMAVDEALLISVEKGTSKPVFRLYGWNRPTVSIGYLQDHSPFVPSGLPIVRRITGGRAVLHQSEITYCVVCPSNDPLYRSGISGAYLLISRAIASALKEAGIDASLARTRPSPGARSSRACFRSASRHEILVGGRKLVGSAQRRFKNGLLQHGSIILEIDRELNRRLFGPEALESMTSVADVIPGLDELRLRDAIVKNISRTLGVSLVLSTLTPEEENLTEELFKKKYSTAGWNLSRAKARSFLTP